MLRMIIEADPELLASKNGMGKTPAEWAKHEKKRHHSAFLTSYVGGTFVTNPVTKEVLDKHPNCKLVAVSFTGFNHVDLEACKERGISVVNVPAYSTDSVAELSVGLALAVYREITASERTLRAGGWVHSSGGMEIRDKVVGIVGLGDIGLRTAELFKAFGPSEILGWSRRPKPAFESLGKQVSIEELFDRSDIVSLHVALNAETQGIIGRSLMERLRPESVLINVARGGVCDQPALADLLSQRRFRAGLKFHIGNSTRFAPTFDMILPGCTMDPSALALSALEEALDGNEEVAEDEPKTPKSLRRESEKLDKPSRKLRRNREERMQDFLEAHDFKDVGTSAKKSNSFTSWLSLKETMYPLHVAASHGNSDIVRILLGAGADPLQKTSRGRTAADFAKAQASKLAQLSPDMQWQYLDIVNLLENNVKVLTVRTLHGFWGREQLTVLRLVCLRIFAALLIGWSLDVFATEPIPAEDPILKVPPDQAVMIPHVAYKTVEALRRRMEITATNIKLFADGQPRNVVLDAK
eukprot:symbB.v1.2.015636.t5/scaffold1142.1/size245703/5